MKLTKLVNMNSTSETYKTDINKNLTKSGHAWTHPSNSLSWDFMIPKNKNNQAVNWGDIADQTIIQSDYLTPKTNRTLRSLPFSDVHLFPCKKCKWLTIQQICRQAENHVKPVPSKKSLNLC